MVFNPTSKSTNSNRRSRSGFTLVEFALSLGVSTLVAVAVAATMMYSARSLSSMNNYVALNRDSRKALDLLMSDIRGCRGVQNYLSNAGKVYDLVLTDANTNTLEYKFDSSDDTLKRIDVTSTLVLLTNCTGEFKLYTRVPSNTWDHYAISSSINSCKLIRVNWTSSRKAMGAVINTEDVQTAQIVLRN